VLEKRTLVHFYSIYQPGRIERSSLAPLTELVMAGLVAAMTNSGASQTGKTLQ
jgi:hypothetical protein